MRKDYVPALDESADGMGADEQLWENIWEGRDLDVDDLDSREEFALMKPCLESLPEGAKILDGGCGLGAWEIGLSRRGYDVVGMDFCRSIVGRLKENIPDCSFVDGDIRDTGFEDASFDMYFSLGVFEHFESGPGDCLDEAYRILKPGGLLFITVPFQNMRHIFADRTALHKWDEHFTPDSGYEEKMRFYQWHFTAPEISRELELHGFRCLSTAPFHKDVGLRRTFKHLLHIDSATGWGKTLRRLVRPIVPAGWVSHMIAAVGRRSPD